MKTHKDMRPVQKWLNEKGVQETEGHPDVAARTWCGMYPQCIETVHGPLVLHVKNPTGRGRSRVYTVFCRFVTRDRKILNQMNANSCTGKWNFHEFTKDALYESFTSALEMILPGKEV